MTLKEEPVPPILADFGLSDKIVAELPQLWFRDSYHTGTREIYTYIVFDVLLFAFLFGQEFHPSFGYVIGFLGFSFINIIPFIATWVLMGLLERYLYQSFNNNFARYCDFQRAFAKYEEHKREYDARLQKLRLEYWRGLSGVKFERELGRLFSLMGYSVSYTPATADGGVDILLRKSDQLTVVQCKAHNKPISIGVIRELSASMLDFHADKAIIACFNGLTKPAADYTQIKQIEVMTLREIVALQRKYDTVANMRDSRIA